MKKEVGKAIFRFADLFSLSILRLCARVLRIFAFFARLDFSWLLLIVVGIDAKLDEIAVRVAQVDTPHGAARAVAGDNAGFGGDASGLEFPHDDFDRGTDDEAEIQRPGRGSFAAGRNSAGRV